VRPLGGADSMSKSDITFFDIVRTNQWRRPITFSKTASRDGMSWLEPYGRTEGIFWRIVPSTKLRANVPAMRENLLSKYLYRGYADSSVVVDNVSAIIGSMYLDSLLELADVERSKGDVAACKRVVAKTLRAIPPERLAGIANLREVPMARCNAAQ
jgi:hypothetical protein